jgi:TonB family protein
LFTAETAADFAVGDEGTIHLARNEGYRMSDIWKRCEGQIVDNQFPLLQFLANTKHSAVFLTSLGQGEARKAAIKFISADIPAPEEQLGVWNQAAQLEHPNILRVFHSGHWRIAGLDILYVVTEYAAEDLSQFLPNSGLTVEETHDLLHPLVGALEYLHGKGIAHSHVKPSNLMAINEQLKLSSDTIFPVGRARESHRDLDAYDAPENSAAQLITATRPGDVWSLGVTLVEALTQQVPALPFDDSAELALSETIPEPFLEIARHCLVRDPAHRWAISEIAAHLNPAPLAAAAGASLNASAAGTMPAAVSVASELPASRGAGGGSAAIPPLSVPLSNEPAIPLAKLPKVPVAAAPRRETKPQSEATIALPSYVIPIVLFSVMVLGAILTIPKFFRRAPGNAAKASNAAAPLMAKANPATVGKPVAETKPASKAAGENSAPAADEQKKNAATVPYNGPVAGHGKSEAPGVVFANSSKSGGVTKSSAGSAERGEVLEQRLPEVPKKALGTIHGTVRVVVGVQVDAAGNVSNTELDSPGPSKYFADLARQAAEQWQFASPVANGQSLPSRWTIRFVFSRSGVVAVPTQKLQ